MKRFGFSIANDGPRGTVFHYRGRRTRIRAGQSISRVFPAGLDAADAVDELQEVVLQLAASVCAETRECDFEVIPDEFGYRLIAPYGAEFKVRLVDPEPSKFVLPSGVALTTSRPR